MGSIYVRIGIATLCRLLLNTARRFAYPFAPELSRGLAVPLPAVTSMIAANQATGLVGMFFGPLGDRFGYQRMMMFGLGLLVVGMLAGGLFPSYGIVLAGLFMAGLGKSVFDPALQAYVSERVSFRRRGLVIGILEFAWAGSTLVGIPLVALLIDRFGWRAPFIALGGFGCVAFVALMILFPGDPAGGASRRTGLPIGTMWKQLLLERRAIGVLGFAFFISAANDNLFVVYGAWLENNFGLGILAIGAATSAIGVAELTGEVMTAVLADRIGLKRSVLFGLTLCSLCYLMLPVFGSDLVHALGGLFALFLLFEFTVVSSLSLSTELLPEYRATMMAGYFAAAGIGRVVGALIGGGLWLKGGMGLIGIVSGTLSVLGLISLAWGLKGWRPGMPPE